MKKLLCFVSPAVLILLLVHSAVLAFNLPDTGQTLCYNSYNVIPCAGTGQDGEFSIYPLSYTDNGDYTVTDNNTGLMWEKCSAGQTGTNSTCSGTATNYISPGNPFSSVCVSRTTGGHNDWRVPSKKELITIVDYSVSSPGPAITSYFPKTQGGNYCSSTPYVGDSTKGWYVYFLDGEVSGGYYNGTSCALRCVRGTQTQQTLLDNGDYTVTDQRTGLMWQKCSAGQTNDSSCSGTATAYSWTNALSYCNTLVLPAGGYSDWRMPNIKELESITDDTANSPRINATFFPNTPGSLSSQAYWSSTTNVDFADYLGYAWGLGFYYGSIATYSEGYGNYVRCVRGSDPVRLLHGASVTPYLTFHDAYAAALDGDTIQAQAGVSGENVTCASVSGIHVGLKGGYDSGFALNTGFTTIGSLTISSGTVTTENLIIQ